MIPYVVTLVFDDEVVQTWHSRHPLAKTIRIATSRAVWLPSCWVGIRKAGELRAEIETDWKGQVSEVSIHAGPLVTSMNPAWLLARM